jgi:hypothetical protein
VIAGCRPTVAVSVCPNFASLDWSRAGETDAESSTAYAEPTSAPYCRGTVPRRPPGQRQTNPRLTRIPADPSSFAGFSLGRLAVRKASPCRAELIWSAVLMPSMRLSSGVQNSGSVPVRAAPRSRPDAKQADFYLVMATLVLAVGTLLLAFFQGLSRLVSGSLPGAPLATHPRIGNCPGSILTRSRGPWC